MRTIYLNMESTCRGHLCKLQSPQVIGCAMGEILFQAGVPLDVLDRFESTYMLLSARPEYTERLAEYLGICLLEPVGETPRTDPCGWYRTFSLIEVAYDAYVETRRTHRDSSLTFSLIELLARGQEIGVEFVWGFQPQKLNEVPVPSKVQEPSAVLV